MEWNHFDYVGLWSEVLSSRQNPKTAPTILIFSWISTFHGKTVATHALTFLSYIFWQGRNHEKMLLRPLRWWAEYAPLGWDRVKVSKHLGATAVVPVAPVITSLFGISW